MSFVDIAKLIERDRELKGGPEFDEESINLTNIYQGQARALTRKWLKDMGQGDPDNIKPFQTKLLKRLIHTAAVTYATPPTRRLEVDGIGMPDEMQARVEKSYRKTDRGLKQGDRWRTVLGQSVIFFSPSHRERRTNVRIFQPHNVLRDVDDSHADQISSDQQVAFRIKVDEDDPTRSVFYYFVQVKEGIWDAFRVNGAGELIDDDRDALYPNGEVPFDGAPFVMIYDEDPEGSAYVPIDETRTAFALGQNVVLNEVMYLLKQEAHTVLYGSGFTNTQDLPDKWGAGAFWGFEDPEASIQPVNLNPKLTESIAISRHIAEVFCAGEGLPADYFLASRKYESGAAGRLRQQDLEARRQDQQQDALETEEAIFVIKRAIENTYASQWKVKRIPEEAELAVELGRPWQPVDLAELQKTYAFDMSIGVASGIDYMMERDRSTYAQAVKKWEKTQIDREKYPLRENPAAILGGQKSANGEGSATPIEQDASSINPNRAASNEEASTVGAARKGLRPRK